MWTDQGMNQELKAKAKMRYQTIGGKSVYTVTVTLTEKNHVTDQQVFVAEAEDAADAIRHVMNYQAWLIINPQGYGMADFNYLESVWTADRTRCTSYWGPAQ